jgi:ubiquinone/menaquinone biosynthesis C-methylase UbiE
MTPSASSSAITEWCPSLPCVDPIWEAAYQRFESEEEEKKKFRRRFRLMGVEQWPRDAAVVNLFCGTGRELNCLSEMGFTNLEGVDLSRSLLEAYRGPAKLYVGDCRDLKFEDNSKDYVVIQGGVHHLPNLPGDVEKCLSEVRRILKPGGKLALVEPWWTPFLRTVHFAHRFSLPRKLYPRLDALAVMTEQEAGTYFPWLNAGRDLLPLFGRNFTVELQKIEWGKLMFVGSPR